MIATTTIFYDRNSTEATVRLGIFVRVMTWTPLFTAKVGAHVDIYSRIVTDVDMDMHVVNANSRYTYSCIHAHNHICISQCYRFQHWYKHLITRSAACSIDSYTNAQVNAMLYVNMEISLSSTTLLCKL